MIKDELIGFYNCISWCLFVIFWIIVIIILGW